MADSACGFKPTYRQENPNIEYRNPKQIRMPKIQMIETKKFI